jgi:hypothetical protein
LIRRNASGIDVAPLNKVSWQQETRQQESIFGTRRLRSTSVARALRGRRSATAAVPIAAQGKI